MLNNNQFENGFIFMREEVKLIVDWLIKMNKRDQLEKVDIKKEIVKKTNEKSNKEKLNHKNK